MGGTLGKYGTMLLKNEDLDAIKDTIALFSDKFVRIDPDRMLHPEGVSPLLNFTYIHLKVIDSHLIGLNSLNLLYYCKLDGKADKMIYMFNSLEPTKGKITSLSVNSKYLYVSKGSGIYQLSRSFFKNKNSSVEESNKLIPVLLYPNPSSEYINIILNTDEEYRYVVIDNAGRQVDNGIIKNSQIDIKDYAPGSYVLKVSSKSESYSTKFIKN